jgi:hypothetical protein
MLSVIEEVAASQKQNENTTKKRAQLFGATSSPLQAEEPLRQAR